MLDLQISPSDINRLKSKLDRVNPAKKAKALVRAMDNAGLLVERRLKTNLSNKILKRRTGRLAQSIGSKTVFESGGILTQVGSGVRTGKRVAYANILETGGTIRAKNRKYLTVPLPGALTPAGATRYPSARQYPNTFVRRNKNGNLIIYEKRGKKSIRPLFVLKRQVTIPAKKYLSSTLSEVKSRITDVILGSVDRELNG